MKASNYHMEWMDDPILEKIAEYTETYPLPEEQLADLDWQTEDDEIFFYQDIEEESEIDFSNEALDAAFGGELKVAHLLSLLGQMEKNARISTQSERTKARMYRMQNKAEISRKAKIRRRKTRSGVHRKKKRIGTAAGGYQFITAPSSSGGANRAQPRLPKHTSMKSSDADYDPEQKVDSTESRSTLRAL